MESSDARRELSSHDSNLKKLQSILDKNCDLRTGSDNLFIN